MLRGAFYDGVCRGPARSMRLGQLSSVFVDREDDIDWAALWQLMDESDPAEQRHKSFATLRSIYDRTISVSDLRDLSHWNGHGPLQAATRASSWRWNWREGLRMQATPAALLR